jgi:hypothetical protein
MVPQKAAAVEMVIESSGKEVPFRLLSGHPDG